MFQKFKYHILLHVIIFIWGFTGILGKLIHLEALHIVWWRVIIAFFGLWIALFFLKKELRVKSKKRLIQIALVGIFVSLHWITFYKAIQLSTASLGILCLSTATLHVVWLEPLVMKRKFSWLEFILGLIVVYGIYFVSSDFKANEYLALAYGLTSALCAALFSVFNAKLAQDTPSYQITFYEMLVGILFLSILLVLDGRLTVEVFDMRISDLLWLLFLGLVCTSFAFLVTIEIVKRLGAFTVSLSINLEPVYTILLAIVILNENEILGIDFYVGSLVIIAVVILNPILKNWIGKSKPKKVK
jgi:drug/metabolite transporter (DMT)-like permease